jgi:hypothetical protein
MSATLIGTYELTEGRDHTRLYSGRRSAKRVFLVVFDMAGSIPNTQEIVTAAQGAGTYAVPTVGDAHPQETGAIAVQVGPVEETQSRYIYRVPVQYDTETDVPVLTNPTNDPWKINFSSESRMRVREQALIASTWLNETIGATKIVGTAAGAAIAAKSGEAFNPPISESDDLEIITLSHNVASPNPETLGAYRNTMNSADITIAARTVKQWCGKMLNIGIDGPNVRNNVTYYVVTFRIGVIVTKLTAGSLPMETWAHKVANVGYSQLVGGKRKAIKIDGVRPPTPVALSDTGTFDDSKTDPYIWLVFATLEEKAWSSLSLPASL